jgi:hypothetical protein
VFPLGGTECLLDDPAPSFHSFCASSHVFKPFPLGGALFKFCAEFEFETGAVRLPALEAALPGAVLSPVGVLVPERMSSGGRIENIASEDESCEAYSSNGSGTEARICSSEGSELGWA